MTSSKRNPYSALVELRLIVGGVTYALSQLGPGFAIAAEDLRLDPTIAKIEVVVDKRVSNTYTVYLPNGIESKRFQYF